MYFLYILFQQVLDDFEISYLILSSSIFELRLSSFFKSFSISYDCIANSIDTICVSNSCLHISAFFASYSFCWIWSQMANFILISSLYCLNEEGSWPSTITAKSLISTVTSSYSWENSLYIKISTFKYTCITIKLKISNATTIKITASILILLPFISMKDYSQFAIMNRFVIIKSPFLGSDTSSCLLKNTIDSSSK